MKIIDKQKILFIYNLVMFLISICGRYIIKLTAEQEYLLNGVFLSSGIYLIINLIISIINYIRFRNNVDYYLNEFQEKLNEYKEQS